MGTKRVASMLAARFFFILRAFLRDAYIAGTLPPIRYSRAFRRIANGASQRCDAVVEGRLHSICERVQAKSDRSQSRPDRREAAGLAAGGAVRRHATLVVLT